VLYEKEVRKFYYNVEFTKDGNLNTQVNGIILHLNEDILGEILKVSGKESKQLQKDLLQRIYLGNWNTSIS